jgi:hypothetical protein
VSCLSAGRTTAIDLSGSLSVSNYQPPAPPTISGPASVECNFTGGVNYSCSQVADAENYEWTLPPGWTGQTSGQSIIVNPTPTGGGTLSVRAKVKCGLYTNNGSYFVTRPAPQLGSISGPDYPCYNTPKTYSVSAIGGSGATYNWTASGGFSIISGANQPSVTVISSGAAGTLSVSAVNACGQSNTVSKQIRTSTPLPSQILFVEQQPCSDGRPGVVSLNPSLGSSDGVQYYWSSDIGFVVPGPNGDAQVYTPYGYGFPINVSAYAVNDCGSSPTYTATLYNQQCPGGFRAASNPHQLVVAPNPVRDAANAVFTLPEAATVNMEMISPAVGRLQAILSNDKRTPGEHHVSFDTGKLPPGSYTLRLVVQTSTTTSVSMVQVNIVR